MCIPFLEMLCPALIMPAALPLSQLTMCPGLRHSWGHIMIVCHWGIFPSTAAAHVPIVEPLNRVQLGPPSPPWLGLLHPAPGVL